MNLVKETARTIRQYAMLTEGQAVLVALSGGADSVALVCVLRELGYKVHAYHLNHCLRAEEAERDAAFVHSLCKTLGIPCQIERADVKAYAAQIGQSVETAARKLRYERLEQCALQLGIARIATAHTADDNLETMLFHLSRGTGGKGMAGIPPVRGRIIRPLWHAVRTEIEVYLREHGQQFVTDSSNLTLDYTRNRIRHQVVPVLRAVNPHCAGAAARLAEQLREDNEALDALAEQALANGSCENGTRLSVFDTFPAVRGRMMIQMLNRAGVPMQHISAKHIGQLTDLLSAGGDRSCHLPAGFRAYRERGCLRIVFEPERPPIALFDGFCGTLWDTSTRLTIIHRKQGEVFRKTCDTFLADCGTINLGTLTARTAAPQDRLRLAGTRGFRQLKRIFADHHIPPSMQDRLAVIADDRGIIAVQSVGIDVSRLSCGSNILEIRFEGL